ncbi:endonuclease/exonuclease/phosphatase family protein [Microbispora sp. KK1-11]|uniref:endonuclease/exonuclease/phosphatase family protein n=1 Tax=Microbispora sp. KK1-11 TaxID=2053005 RepID=UPI0011594FCD|nr:endonuclease/exonuclease/phosphatase family protein [Microbispora sp. KK1-11]TQS26545.1 endonuclease/exonuclease/phosphatase family protein [Microbispora sp. KK1-11]
MKGLATPAVIAVLAWTSPAAVPVEPTALAVMTWNVCTATNANCRLYQADAQQLAQIIGGYATSQPIRPDVIFLQEFCGGADRTLELGLQQRTGRKWTVRSLALTSNAGAPYACHADKSGRARGAQSIAIAVADDAVTFTSHPLSSPPWYVKRAVLCATIAAKRVRACGTHLSSGTRYDDRQPGAPYRTRQIKEMMAYAAKPGYRSVFGGDLNVAPPDSADGSAAGRRAIVPAYRAYRECDQNGTSRTGRWTHSADGRRKKLDYLFTSQSSKRQCHVAPPTSLSDHRPVYLRVEF